MSKKSEAVIRWRKRTKEKAVAAMGGKCQICGYNKCLDALEFHHIDPSQKDFGIGKLKASPKSISKIINELKKCILLCANCHREFHSGLIELPETYSRLDETIMIGEYELRKRYKQQTAVSSLTISTKEKIDKRKIKLSKEELNDLLTNEFNGNKSALARTLKVSEAAIRKKLKDSVYTSLV